jgi:sulfatase maturation enzyme AslB (radical SAM superfamily)
VFKPSPTFCILPWTHLFVSVEGHLFPCCRCVDARLPNVDEHGRPYRFTGQDSLEEAWNSQYMKRLRSDMLTGCRPSPCQGCHHIEDLGIQSDRERLNLLYASYMTDPHFAPREDGTASLVFKTMDLRLGNLCNLRCQMCSPRASRALSREFAALYKPQTEVQTAQSVQDSDWFDGQKLQDLIERFSADLEELHFAGGEPLLISSMFDLLRHIVGKGWSSRISLAYISNLTTFPAAVRGLWPHFKKVRVSASLDGYQKVNSYIRFPSQWNSLDANLRAIDAEAEALNCKTLKFYTTVQIYNIFSLPKLFDYVLETFSRFEPFPNLILVREPSCFDIQVLPQQIKKTLTATYRDYIQSRRAIWSERATLAQIAEFSMKLEAVIRHMNERDASFLLPDFVYKTKLHDSYRGHRAEDMIPELATLLSANEGT